MSFKPVIHALHPIQVVVWGEQAMGFLGMGTALNACLPIFLQIDIITNSVQSFLLIPSEFDYDIAAQKLVEAGFRPAPWTYGVIDPDLITDDEIGRRIKSMEHPNYRKLDDNSVRFQFPGGFSGPTRVVLLRSTHVGLSLPNDPSSMEKFSSHKNLYDP